MGEHIPKEVQQRVRKLRKEITRLRDLYHKEDVSEFTDEALDSLKHELAQLEQEYPELITPDSPTQIVSGGVKAGFAKVKHKIRQWSFNDIFTEDELAEFDARMKRALNIQEPIRYFAEEKIDGVKIILEYTKGKLVTAATRGDGRIGEDITDNVRTIRGIPQTLKKPVDIIVEGEAYITVDELERINRQQKKEGKELYANPRNLVAGSLRQLDASITASRKLYAFIYDVAQYKGDLNNQKEEITFIKQLGLPVSKHTATCDTLEDIVRFWKNRAAKRDSLQYWIDGIVVKVHSHAYQEQLGYTGKAPRFAVAFKFPAEQATTVMESLDFQIGRTGVITPVANLKPLRIAGTTVARATLHNEDQIQRLDVRIGDTVVVQKAGDIIPEIVSVVKNLRPKNAKKIVWPKTIPGCGGDGSIERVPGDVAWRCVDRESGEIIIRRLIHFASKGAVDMDGLGEKTVRRFVEEGLLKQYADIYTLKKETIAQLEGFKDKSAQLIIDTIEAHRTIPLHRFLTALSIDGVGEESAHILAQNFETLDALRSASFETLRSIRGVGESIATSITEWFADSNKKTELENLLQHITVPNTVSRGDASHPLFGKRIVITGKMERYERNELKALLRSVGALVSDSVSSQTDFLFVGTDAGSKLQKAQKLGVPIVQEADIPSRIGL